MKTFLGSFIIFFTILGATYSYPDYCSTEKFYPNEIRFNLHCDKDNSKGIVYKSTCGIKFFNYLNHQNEKPTDHNLANAVPKKVAKRQTNHQNSFFPSLFLSSLNRQFNSNQPTQPQQNIQLQPIQFSNRFNNNQQPQHANRQQNNAPQYSNNLNFPQILNPYQDLIPQLFSNTPLIDLIPRSFSSPPVPNQNIIPSSISNPLIPTIIINIARNPNWNKRIDEEFAQIEADRKRDRHPNWNQDAERQHKMDAQNGVVRMLDINQYINSLPKNSVLYEMLTNATKAAYYKGIPRCEDHLIAPLRLYQLSLREKHDVKSFQRPDGTRARFEFNLSCPEVCEFEDY